MSDIWNRWVGQVVDHKYQLLQYLGSTDHSAVFLAEFRDPEPRQAAVKFVSADLPDPEKQLAAWTNAAQLSHPNLIRIFGTGRCKIDDMELLYVAMEYAEENLAQILPQRALQDEEAREMLNGVVDVLVYLHDKNLTHGHVKPSNILAIGELLKLSSDTILPTGEVREMRRERSVYDAPEIPAALYTPAADIWSLGATIVEAITQQPAVLPFNEQADPVIPPALQEPFLGIAQHALRRDPKRRWSSAQVAERLNPAAAAAKAAAAKAAVATSIAAAASASTSAVPASLASAPVPAPPQLSPLSVPLAKEPAIPLAKLPPAPDLHSAASRPPVRAVPRASSQAFVLPNYVVPLFAGVLVLIAVVALPKILRHREASAPTSTDSSVSASSTSPSEDNASSATSRDTPPAKQPAFSNRAPEKPPAASTRPLPAAPAPAVPAPAPAVLRSNETTPAKTPKASSASPARGEVLDQVLPQPSGQALATIHGTVRVGVKVHVDSAGNVSGAVFEAPGPSRYFADLSLKAARSWVFSPPEADGQSVSRDWLIQFYFTPSGARAVSEQVTP